MKKLLLAAAVTGGLVLAQAASAQTCTGFSGPISGASGSTTGDTCQPGGSALAGACSNAETLNGAGVAIFEVTTGQTNSYSFTVNSAAFVPWIGYVKGTCSSNTACIDDVTRSGPGEISTAAHTDADTPAGTYFLIVGGVDVDTPGCGSFTVNWGANLPVQLQNFSIE